MKITFEQAVFLDIGWTEPDPGDDTDYANMVFGEWWKKEMGQSIVDQVKETEWKNQVYLEEYGVYSEDY